MSKLNYDLKSQLLNNGLYDFYKLVYNAQHMYYLLTTYGYDFPQYLIPYLFFPLDSVLTYKEFKECEKMFNANRSRSSRLRKKVSKMLEKQCLFLTLTFTDDVLLNTSDTTRRRYIVSFLSQFKVPCIANKDYGKENGREHYHAVIQLRKINYALYSYGAINGEKIIVSDMADLRISKYISKLTNHAIKETTKGSRLIYLHMDKLKELEVPIQLKF